MGKKAIVDFYITTFEREHKDINPPLTAGSNAGLTPLYDAAYEDNLDIVDAIVKGLERQHQDINAPLTGPKFMGFTPLYIAARQGKKNIVVYYINKFEKLHKNINPALTLGHDAGWTPFLVAAKNWQNDIVKTFVYRGVQLTDSLPAGKTAEEIAREANNEKLADYLHTTVAMTKELLNECYAMKDLVTLIDGNLKKLADASPEHKKEIQNFIKDSLVRANVLSIGHIKRLIRKGADITAQGKGGYSPLHCLIGYYDPQAATAFDKAAKELIDSGKLDLNALTDNGDSALSLAAKFGNSRIFKYLIKKGADPKIGNNPITTATQYGQNNFLRYVLMQ